MAKLYFYYSAMNAGKSTVLLQANHNYQERGMETILFTPSIDTRYGKGKITSRIGISADGVPVEGNMSLFDYVKDRFLNNPKLACVLVDEAQFLTKRQVKELTDIVDRLNVPVLAYGLRSNHEGELFEGSHYLLAWSDQLIELKTVCHCGRKATMTMKIDSNGRKVTGGESIDIGGNEKYISTCRVHYKAGDSGTRAKSMVSRMSQKTRTTIN